MKPGSILTKADAAVEEFLAENGPASMPAIVAACVGWSIQNGAGDLIRGTLLNAVRMSHDAEAAWKEGLS